MINKIVKLFRFFLNLEINIRNKQFTWTSENRICPDLEWSFIDVHKMLCTGLNWCRLGKSMSRELTNLHHFILYLFMYKMGEASK